LIITQKRELFGYKYSITCWCIL